MGSYNDVYERLMGRAEKNKTDLVGMVAYAIYKQTKVEYCRTIEEEGAPITPEELQTYHKRVTDTMLDAFETKASAAVLQYREDYLKENRDRIVQDALGQMKEDLQKSIQASTSFGQGFWAGFASSLAAAVVIVVLTLVGTYNYPDLVHAMLKAVSPSVTEKPNNAKQ
ncbi:MAG: hypothetical protein HQL87_12810 [Magnetococcales bacterium]|nr:hypothetical protein [Magnetococcales bacterium]